ncbi:MAG: hypothetical protein EP326_11340 [Deltaproteobacteria bacterium]|nr:MAG: hypothetical protein EP326_11340 [Deltaproteobacteria bacterium]
MVKLFLPLLLIFSFQNLRAEIKHEVQLLNRCYSQLVNKRISPDHELVQKIIKQELSGSEACSELIGKLSFDQEGMLTPKNDESLEILRTIQKIHDSWFPRFNFNISTQDFPNTDFYDANEMGYHFTWVLLKNEKVENVLTKKRSFMGLRESEKEHRYFIDRRIRGHRQLRTEHPVHKWKIGGSEDEKSDEFLGPISFWSPELTQFGKLVGLRPYTDSKNRIKKWLGGKKLEEFDTKAPQGGGIIGTSSYLLLNTEHIDQRNDGGNRLHRRWATSVTSDLLCRNLPILSKKEAEVFVRKKSKIGFRQKADCMNCHSTIDTMAAVIRNMENYNSGNVDIHYTIRNIYMHQTKSVHAGELPDSSEYFFETSPEGIFIHKDIFGRRIETKVRSLNELGKALSQTKDFYYCLSKRYFEFFTGIEVNIEQIDWSKSTDPVVVFLKKSAEELRRTQNVKKYLSSLFNSPFYKEGK